MSKAKQKTKKVLSSQKEEIPVPKTVRGRTSGPNGSIDG